MGNPNVTVQPGVYQFKQYRADLAAGMAKTNNWEMVSLGTHLQAILNRPPEFYVYIYNIAQRAFEVRRPTAWPLVRIASCPKEQPYVLVALVPSPIYEQYLDDSGKQAIASYTGEQFARDIVNPSNVAGDQFREITSWADSNGTDDLGRRGLFWSFSNPPKPEEVEKARERMERFYQSMLQQADALWQDPRTRREIGPEHHLAANHFNYESAWHSRARAPETCENCGESVTREAAFHRNSAGIICVRDWRRSVDAGVKTREEVPVEKRWWNEPKK